MAAINIRTEVTGSIWKILLQPGAAVAEGDVIMIVESMKMEIPVMAEQEGRLASLAVAEGDAVAEGQTVAQLEA